MTIKEWPSQERPREKLLTLGAASLSDAELLAISIRTGVKGKSAIDLAREALKNFGGLRALLLADAKSFCNTRGLGPVKYVQLQAILEMGRRHLHERLTQTSAITNSKETRRYISACLRDYQHEVFACLFLDIRHRVICFEELFHGTINFTYVYPREVVKHALKHNASAIILAHNHPSGVATPSPEDIQLTKHLQKALELIDIQVLDHIVVGDGATVSFRERGWV